MKRSLFMRRMFAIYELTSVARNGRSRIIHDRGATISDVSCFGMFKRVNAIKKSVEWSIGSTSIGDAIVNGG